MEDVARLAGVSAMTVSRAFQRPELVSEEFRARVFEAAKAMGYVPNRAARALAASRSMNIVVLIPSITNLVFTETLAGINEVLQPSGYQELIGITRYTQNEEERLLRSYLGAMPDGLLITGTNHSSATWKLLEGTGAPTVHMMDLAGRRDCYSVGFSQLKAGYDMGCHLVERGYRRIGFVAAQLDPRALERAEGFRQALREAGRHDALRELLVSDFSSISLGAALLDRLLAQAPDCDAVFFGNDDLALGALAQCQRAGIAVPQRLAISGFNDLEAAAWSYPALTTIATPRREVGRQAALMLLDLIGGHDLAEPTRDLGFTLKVRGST
jgi:LacI family gluconate utilization system Gnt-I transcriptional repressor